MTGSEATSPEPLDAAQVATLRQLAAAAGPSFLSGLVATFLDRARQLVTTIGSATDPGAAVAAAHELKGSASTIGAVRVADLARTIELQGRSGQLPEPAQVEVLDAELARAGEALTDLT